MLTRNRGKFKSVVEILGLKKKNKKSASKSKESSKSRSKKASSIKLRKVVRQKKDIQREKSPKIESEEEKHQTTEYVCEDRTETPQSEQNVFPIKLEPSTLRQKTEKLRVTAKANRSFILCDPDLHEVLGEIKQSGRLFRSRRKFFASKAQRKQQLKEISAINFHFKDEAQEDLFKRLVEILDEVNREMDKKDAVLASCSLVRPGIRKSLRIRRKIRRQNAVDLCKVRLRPNPRRKRFSDASISDGEVEASANLTRSDRNVSLAAKKLAMAKSRAVNERRKSNTSRVRPVKFSYGAKNIRSLRRTTLGRRMRVGEVSEDYEDNMNNEIPPVPEAQDQAQERTDDPEHMAEEQRRRIMNPQLSLLGRLLLGMHCTAVSGEEENEILIKNLSDDDWRMLNQRITGTIFTLKTISMIKDEESGEEKFKVVLVYMNNAQSLVREEIAGSEDGSQKVSRRQKPASTISRSKSIRGGRKRPVRQAHPLQILGLRHLRAQVEAVRNSHSQNNTEEARKSPQLESSKPIVPKSRILPAFFLNHFRRTPNRRVVRKVYTGSALVPKILNRRRPQTIATSNNQPLFGLPPQYSQIQTATVTTLSMPTENTQLPQVQATEIASSTTQADKDNQETIEVKKEDVTSDKESNSTEAHSNCSEQSCVNNCTQANPASSMCASQILKLKRQQDDKQLQQPASGQPAIVTTAAVTTLVDTVAKITLSKPVPAIPALQPATQKLTTVQGLRIDRSGKLVVCSSPPVITLPASTPIVARINPTTATLVPRAMTFLVPAISSPVTTIVKHQAPMVSSSSMPHIQVQHPNVVPTTKRVPIRSAATFSAKLPLVPLANAVRVSKIEGSVLTNAPIIQSPAAISANRPTKRPTIHKCHTLRKISPKIPPPPLAPCTSTSPSMLKSILESGSKTPEVASHPSLAATQLPLQGPSNAATFVTTVSQPPVMSTGVRQDNQASSAHHQSRGTWQVGGRAIVLDVSLNRSSNSTAPPAPQKP